MERKRVLSLLKEDNSNESIMLRLLEEKQKNPLNKGDYSPETDELACVKNQKS